MNATGWPIPVATFGPQVNVGTALWQFNGQLMVTVIAKATCAFVPGAAMRLVDAAPVRHHDEHVGGHPLRSLVGARELAPMLRMVDVALTGHAYAPAGHAHTTVRLGIRRSGALVLDKQLLVQGDRDAAGQPQPFRRINLGYERAYGGIGYHENPIGTGYGPCADVAPNLSYVNDPQPRTACYAPIPADFLSRKRLLGSARRGEVENVLATIPADLDWTYFQAAPADQRLDRLDGDEWLLLEGMHSAVRTVETQLPALSAHARVYGNERAGAPNDVPLRLDMLHLDTDMDQCALVFRGSFPVNNPDARGHMVIAAALAEPDEAIGWPARDDLEIDHGAASFEDERGGTDVIGGAGVEDWSQTQNMSPEAPKSLPFTGPEAVRNASQQSDPLLHTLPIEPTDDVRQPRRGLAEHAAPFAIAPPGAGTGRVDQSLDKLPGAPWHDGSPTPEVAAPQKRSFRTTISSREEQVKEQERRQEEARRAAQAAEAAEAAERAADAAKAAERAAEAQRIAEAAKRDAEERRKQEAERFRAEQLAAEADRQKRLEERKAAQRDKADQLRSEMFGGFKRKR